MTPPSFSQIVRLRSVYETVGDSGLRMRAGVRTAYAMERKFEPESFSENEFGDAVRRNKWGRYRRGMHVPNAVMVGKANQIFSGSEKELNHVLWHVLRFDDAVEVEIHDWLKELSPELQLLVVRPDGRICVDATSRQLQKLERRASMDCLACLVMLLRLNQEQNKHESAWQYAQSIFRVLLMLGRQFEERKLGERIFQIFVIRIFSSIKWNRHRFYLDNYNFLQSAFILDFVSLDTSTEIHKQSLWARQVGQMHKILSGRYGLDWKFGVWPIVGPDNDLGPLSEIEQKEIARMISVRNWSIQNLLSGRNTQPPIAF